MQQETMRGSLFPLFPLRVKCQNHEKVRISPISPILVANVYSSCQDMDHQNRGNRDPLNVFPCWSAKTMRGSLFPLFPLRVKCQNHEKVRISPISPILVANVYSSCQDMDHQNRGNRDPLSVFPSWSAKTMRGPLFPSFPLRVKCQNHDTAHISTILVANVYSSCQDMDHQSRGNRGNRDPLSVFPWWSAKTMKRSLFPLFWWPMSIHPVKTWTTKIGEIGEIGTLSWFWHFALRGNGTLSMFSLDEAPKPWKGPYFHYFGGQCLFILLRHGPAK